MQQYREPTPLKVPRDYRWVCGLLGCPLKPIINPQTPCTNFRNIDSKVNKKDLAIKFLFECSDKLSIKPLTVAAAAMYFHRFYSELDKCEYDEFVSGKNTGHMADAEYYYKKFLFSSSLPPQQSTWRRKSRTNRSTFETWSVWCTAHWIAVSSLRKRTVNSGWSATLSSRLSCSSLGC